MTRENNNSKMSEEDLKVEIMYQSSVFREDQATCPLSVPLNTAKLLQLLESGEFSDVEVTIADHGKVAMAHRLILSAWSEPFAKVRINFAVISCRLQLCKFCHWVGILSCVICPCLLLLVCHHLKPPSRNCHLQRVSIQR